MALLSKKVLQSGVLQCPISYWAQQAKQTAFISEEQEYSYQELDRLVTMAEDHIRHASYPKRLALLFKTNIEHLAFLFALLRSGRVVAILNPTESKQEIDSKLAQVGIDRHELVEFIPDQTDAANRISAASFLNLQEAGTILFSSGSSGRPKDIHHHLSAFAYSALGSSRNIPIFENDRWLLALPCHHMGGLSIIFRSFFAGACVVASSSRNLASEIEKNEISHVSMVSSQFQSLIHNWEKHDCANLRHVLLGGSSIPRHVVVKGNKMGIPFHLSYGSTEMASQICTSSLANTEPGISGRVLPYRSLKISEEGEILVGGECLCHSISGKTPQKNENFPAEAHFQTGDLGKLDEEGRLQVFGRLDNMFISGGENIHPEQIEKAILETGMVIECLVVSIPNEKWGARPIAFISPWKENLAKDLSKKLGESLSKFLLPDGYFALPNLEENRFKHSRTELGKKAVRLYSEFL